MGQKGAAANKIIPAAVEAAIERENCQRGFSPPLAILGDAERVCSISEENRGTHKLLTVQESLVEERSERHGNGSSYAAG
jgi:hypothetical protein